MANGINPFVLLGIAGIGLYALRRSSAAQSRAQALSKVENQIPNLLPPNSVWTPNLMEQQLLVATHLILTQGNGSYTSLSPALQTVVKNILTKAQAIMTSQGGTFSRDPTQNARLNAYITSLNAAVNNPGGATKSVSAVIAECETLVKGAANLTGDTLTSWLASNAVAIANAVSDVVAVVSKASSGDQTTLNQLKGQLVTLGAQAGGAVAKQISDAVNSTASGSSDSSGSSNDNSDSSDSSSSNSDTSSSDGTSS